MADVYPTLVKQVFDILQREWKSDIHHHRKPDDIGRGLEVAERVLAHFWSLSSRVGRLKVDSADTAR